ncbi:MAG TPA: ATP-binding protein [Candidatus Baltobacteraceae bacterium]|nr:ATP-binding protein [Candidatus Baltobacteraceae bacterium]
MNKTLSALRNLRPLRRSVIGVLIVIVAMPLISLWATLRVGELSDRITTIDEARLSVSRTLRYTLDEETGIRGYAATGKTDFLQPYRAAHPRIEVLLAELPLAFAHAGLYEVLPKLTDMALLHDQWYAQIAAPLLKNTHRPDAVAIEERGREIVDRLRADTEAIQTLSARNIKAASREILQVMITAGLLAAAWILIVGTFTVLLERRAAQRETDLVMSLVAERDAVERLSDWRSRLLAMLAHDFKSQLAVVIGAAHLLEDFPQRRGDPQLLASVRASGYTLAEMADNAILLARAQERRLVLQRSTFDIGEVVGGVLQRYGAQREVHLYSQTPTAMIDGDRSYVMRVMDNIIGNAVKYSDDPVDVHLGEEAKYVRVAVTDRGVGIAEDDLPRIFEEFWRSEKALSSRNGSGVGLFIVKQIMEAHGGSIRVESEPGKGTTVTLRFPRAMTAFAASANGPVETLKTAT